MKRVVTHQLSDRYRWALGDYPLQITKRASGQWIVKAAGPEWLQVQDWLKERGLEELLFPRKRDAVSCLTLALAEPGSPPAPSLLCRRQADGSYQLASGMSCQRVQVMRGTVWSIRRDGKEWIRASTLWQAARAAANNGLANRVISIDQHPAARLGWRLVTTQTAEVTQLRPEKPDPGPTGRAA